VHLPWRMDKDPVCGRAVTRADVGAESRYQGRSYFFCSTGCKERFEADPKRYAMRRLEDETPRGTPDEK
jgi:P-type Cu+ transporter